MFAASQSLFMNSSRFLDVGRLVILGRRDEWIDLALVSHSVTAGKCGAGRGPTPLPRGGRRGRMMPAGRRGCDREASQAYRVRPSRPTFAILDGDGTQEMQSPRPPHATSAIPERAM